MNFLETKGTIPSKLTARTKYVVVWNCELLLVNFKQPFSGQKKSWKISTFFVYIKIRGDPNKACDFIAKLSTRGQLNGDQA